MGTKGIYPRKVNGFRDIAPELNQARTALVRTVSDVYQRYGFEHWDTPVWEYAQCLGKYLPDDDTVDQGVYSLRNPELEPEYDERGKELRDKENNVLMQNHHLALRYDLTAPLARMYAERIFPQHIKNMYKSGAKPPLFRRYQYGPVYRYEAKLDPGRYREFWQIDFDTIGTTDLACDAECCAVLSDSLEALGIERGSYEILANNRKLHEGLFERLNLVGDEGRKRDILRVIDKFDKIGEAGVAAELGPGRTDEKSGAKLPGLGLDEPAISGVLEFLRAGNAQESRTGVLDTLSNLLGATPTGDEGLKELQQIHESLTALGLEEDRVRFDATVARGLAYYTGPVFEAVSKLTYKDAKGKKRAFGSICGGGRYDGLVENLLDLRVPATGASLGVDRLLELLSRTREQAEAFGPVLVVVMDKDRGNDYLQLAAMLRAGGIAAEVYYGMQKKTKTQFSYADTRNCPLAVIAGSNEFDQGTVSIKNLVAGKAASKEVTDREAWRARENIQVEVPRTEMVQTVLSMLNEIGQGN